MGHDPVAMASTAGGVVGLYVAITVHRILSDTSLAGRLGDRYGLAVRPMRVSVGRWRCELNLSIASNDPGTMGRTRSRTRVLKGSASAALLSVCSRSLLHPGASPAGNSEA